MRLRQRSQYCGSSFVYLVEFYQDFNNLSLCEGYNLLPYNLHTSNHVTKKYICFENAEWVPCKSLIPSLSVGPLLDVFETDPYFNSMMFHKVRAQLEYKSDDLNSKRKAFSKKKGENPHD